MACSVGSLITLISIARVAGVSITGAGISTSGCSDAHTEYAQRSIRLRASDRHAAHSETSNRMRASWSTRRHKKAHHAVGSGRKAPPRGNAVGVISLCGGWGELHPPGLSRPVESLPSSAPFYSRWIGAGDVYHSKNHKSQAARAIWASAKVGATLRPRHAQTRSLRAAWHFSAASRSEDEPVTGRESRVAHRVTGGYTEVRRWHSPLTA